MRILKLWWSAYKVFHPLISAVRITRVRIGGVPLRDRLKTIALPFLCIFAPFKRGPVVVGSHKMFLPAGRDSFLSMWMMMEDYERETSSVLSRVLRPGMNAIDLGAHVGYFTLLMARLVGPEGKVFAFEPESNNFNLLKRNTELNGYSNVVLVPKAVTDRHGEVRLFLNPRTTFCHSVFPPQDGRVGSSPVAVEATSLDDFLSALGWPRIDLVKMDIEGGELRALQGMRTLLSKTEKMALIVEFCPDHLEAAGTDPRILEKVLFDSGFSIQIIGDRNTQRGTTLAEIARSLRGGESLNVLCVK